MKKRDLSLVEECFSAVVSSASFHPTRMVVTLLLEQMITSFVVYCSDVTFTAQSAMLCEHSNRQSHVLQG